MPTSLIHAESVARLSKKKPSSEHQRRLRMPFGEEVRWVGDWEEAKTAVNIVGGPGGKNFSGVRACQRPWRPFAFQRLVRLFPPFLSRVGYELPVCIWFPLIPHRSIPQLPRKRVGQEC